MTRPLSTVSSESVTERTIIGAEELTYPAFCNFRVGDQPSARIESFEWGRAAGLWLPALSAHPAKLCRTSTLMIEFQYT